MKKFSQLPEADALGGSEYLPIVQDGKTKKIAADRLGGGASSPDWNENDSTAAGYIKNRPFFKEEREVDYLRLTGENPDPETGLCSCGRRIGLVAGEAYTVELITDGEAVTLKCTAADMSEMLDFPAGSGVIALLPPKGEMLPIYDGADIDADGNPVLADNAIYVLEGIGEMIIHGIKSVEIIYTKLDNAYLNIDSEYDPTGKNPLCGQAVAKALEEVTVKGVEYEVEPIRPVLQFKILSESGRKLLALSFMTAKINEDNSLEYFLDTPHFKVENAKASYSNVRFISKPQFDYWQATFSENGEKTAVTFNEFSKIVPFRDFYAVTYSYGGPYFLIYYLYFDVTNLEAEEQNALLTHFQEDLFSFTVAWTDPVSFEICKGVNEIDV